MKIRPVILCGGSGTRLWSDKKHHQPKQFIDFGNWTLFGKTLERIKNSIFHFLDRFSCKLSSFSVVQTERIIRYRKRKSYL